MKAAQITEWNTTPKYVDIPAPPTPGPDEVQIKVIAAGIHRVVRGRVSGKHFSATKLPHIVGADGVGTTADGQLVYFSTFWERGSMAELVNVEKGVVTPISALGADPLRVAGLVNPASASYMALKERVFSPPTGFFCLVLGATSTSGKVALEIAKQLGAGTMIGAARNAAAVKSAGYDVAIELKDPVDQTDFSPAADVDVILDFVYGPATVHLFKSLKPKTPVQYVQIGTIAQPTIDLPGDLLRSKDITIRGAAPGAYSAAALQRELPNLVNVAAKIEQQEFKVVPLEDIESAWADMKDRIVVQVSKYP